VPSRRASTAQLASSCWHQRLEPLAQTAGAGWSRWWSGPACPASRAAIRRGHQRGRRRRRRHPRRAGRDFCQTTTARPPRAGQYRPRSTLATMSRAAARSSLFDRTVMARWPAKRARKARPTRTNTAKASHAMGKPSGPRLKVTGSREKPSACNSQACWGLPGRVVVQPPPPQPGGGWCQARG